MRKVCVVTGGSGFIGSHLVDELHTRSRRVINIDKKPPATIKDDVLYEHADLADPNFTYLGDQPDVLFHLAAMPWTMTKGESSWFYGDKDIFRSNASGTYNALHSIKPECIVFSSTANVYGEGRKIEEFDPIRLSSPYGYSKWVAEEIIRKSGVPFTIFRFGTVVGTRGRCFPNRLVWCSINNTPVDVFYKGQTYRDLIDVRDIVDALIKAPSWGGCGTFNLSMGMETSGKQLVEIVSQEAEDRGYHLNYKLVPYGAPGYIKKSTLSTKQITDTVGWAPRYDVYSIIQTLFDYYEDKNAIEPPDWRTL